MVDLHRHDEFSTFDGFGKASELAEIAKKLGHTSLGTSNHGNTNGLIQTYLACKETGIKSILGVEGYFLPVYKPQTRGYHLCLFAKNLKGYSNLNKMQYEGEKQKYYNPIWGFDLLKKHSDGLICTSACVASYLGQSITKGSFSQAEKFLVKMKEIFGEDFYVEIQPYKISEVGLQEKINYYSFKLAEKHDIKCILTSDSHRGLNEDLPTYMKMHEIANHNSIDIEETYGERYMPSEKEIIERFVMMHGLSHCKFKEYAIKGIFTIAQEMIANLEEIEEKCELNYLDKLQLKLPKMEDATDSFKLITEKVKQGLKDKGKYKKEYIERCKEELEVIKAHSFADYFLIVADYVNYAKNKEIAVGPGRGSVCNCLVAYTLGITEVDSLFFNLDFRRFLRIDKKKTPDIDLDFQTSRRQEVIEYLCEKYRGHAARICSYGLYKVDNLINDLAKVCGLVSVQDGKQVPNKQEIANIKKFVNDYIEDGELKKEIVNCREGKYYNSQYDDIITHFSKLYKKIRFIGTHAAGVAITGGDLLNYVALKMDKDGNEFTNYDLSDVESINVIKFDILGLKTMESISELRQKTGVQVDYDKIVKDEVLLEQFREGICDGIFQFEKPTARNILKSINCDCFDDIIAASSMNRPGPLQLKMPQIYADNKMNPDGLSDEKPYDDYVKESYGTIIYQEQVQQICINIGNLEWADADKIMKMLGSADKTYKDKFVKGAVKNGVCKEEAEDLFDKMINYTFNKGHATGYSLISLEEMFYKIYYPSEYWFVKLKYAKEDGERMKFNAKAFKDDVMTFLPHVNYSYETSLRKVDGESVIQLGLNSIKGVGDKAGQFIEQEKKTNGIFTSYDNFYDRCKSRTVTTRVINILKEQGALCFDKKTYINRVTKFNSSFAFKD